jgi:acyl-CoA synthetase (AMP-forming)/AMP-acid ligase II
VLPETLRRFTERFARYGFRPEAMTPVYGLAECTVGLLSPPLGRGPRIDRVRRQPFSRAGRAEPAAADDEGALRFVSCGRPLPGHEVRIVDALGREVGERVEGDSVRAVITGGYYRNPGGRSAC